MAASVTRLIFRQAHDPALWNPTLAGATIVAVAVGSAAEEMRRLTVSVVARAAGTFKIAASVGATTREATVTSAAAGAFDAELTGVPATGLCTVTCVENTTRHDAVAFLLQDGIPLDLPPGRVASLERQRATILAGTSDRVVERHVFNLLIRPGLVRLANDWALGLFGLQANRDVYVPFGAHTGKPVLAPNSQVLDLQRFRSALEGAWKELVSTYRQRFAAAAGGDFQKVYDEYTARRRDAIVSAVDAAREDLQPALRQRILKADLPLVKGAPKIRKKGKKPAADAHAFTMLPFNISGMSGSGLFVNANGATLLVSDVAIDSLVLDSAIELILKTWDFGGRVGVLFGDRLRFKPAGIVVGEPIYTLALAPGEEVQLRQTVETKRQVQMEDIMDREQENSLSLSSTWSTDVSQSLTDTTTMQSTFGGNAGGNVGPFSIPTQVGSIPIPISGTLGVSGSVSYANTETGARAVRVNRQLSAQVAAKLRRQHKTRIEITTDQTSALATTRTIRNANQQRSATHVFSKVYRREQVTLERHDARLCLRLVVDDPSGPIRDRFLTRLRAMDPTYKPAPADESAGPPAKPAVQDAYIDFNTVADGRRTANGTFVSLLFPHFDEWGYNVDVEFPGSYDGEFGGYTLSDARVEVLNFTVEDSGREKFPEGSKTFSGGDAQAEFHNYGRIVWNTQPEYGLETTAGVVGVYERTISYWTAGHFDPMNPSATKVSKPATVELRDTTIRVHTRWRIVDVTQIFTAGSEQLEDTVRRDDLTPAAVLQMRNAIAGDYYGEVLASAAVQNFRFAANRALSDFRHMFAFEEVVIENVPYWATENGRGSRQELANAIERLPIVMTIDDVLTPELSSAQAIVYLPINHGFEQSALRVVDSLTSDQVDWLVEEIESHRQARYPSTGTTVPDYAMVAGPTIPAATAAGATQWASDWEKPQRRFDVLASWQELVPTDGVHVETILSDTVATDEQRASDLETREA